MPTPMTGTSKRTGSAWARRAVGLLAALAAAGAGGCKPDGRPISATGQLQQVREDNARLKADVEALEARLRAQEDQIAVLRGLGPKRLEHLFHVKKIELGRYTEPANLDEEPGIDGVRVFLKPIDADGHALKAAGDITIQLFDLAAKPEKTLLATFAFPVAEARKHWYGGFMTYHYRLDCPWKPPSPKPREITIRVVFTDYLTGRKFTAQKVCKYAPPKAARSGATKPAKPKQAKKPK